jgi:2,3-bisphosphoglycerate-dependent phosphoglycerate mutase
MRRLHLIRHGRVLVDPRQPPSQWELERGACEAVASLALEVGGAGLRRVVSSEETKAVQTARALAAVLGVPVDLRPGLEEHHRLREQHIPSDADFHKAMAGLFSRPSQVVLGTESASAALERFHGAIHDVMAETGDDELVVSHGTVISLLMERGGNGAAMSIWCSLRMPDHVVLAWPSLQRVEGVQTLRV